MKKNISKKEQLEIELAKAISIAELEEKEKEKVINLDDNFINFTPHLGKPYFKRKPFDFEEEDNVLVPENNPFEEETFILDEEEREIALAAEESVFENNSSLEEENLSKRFLNIKDNSPKIMSITDIFGSLNLEKELSKDEKIKNFYQIYYPNSSNADYPFLNATEEKGIIQALGYGNECEMYTALGRHIKGTRGSIFNYFVPQKFLKRFQALDGTNKDFYNYCIWDLFSESTLKIGEPLPCNRDGDLIIPSKDGYLQFIVDDVADYKSISQLKDVDEKSIPFLQELADNTGLCFVSGGKPIRKNTGTNSKQCLGKAASKMRTIYLDVNFNIIIKF